MTVNAVAVRTRLVSALALALVAILGCQAGPASAVPPRAEVQVSEPPRPAEAANPAATLALEAIEPRPTPPKAPTDLPPLSDRSRQQVEKARDLLGQRRFTEAAIELERALRYDPNHPAVHGVLASLHWQAGNTERAKTHAERAIEGDPSQAIPHYVLGRYSAQTGDARRALLEYRTVLLCPGLEENLEVQALTHYYLGRSLSGEGYYSAALSEFGAFRKGAAQLRAQNKALTPEAAGVLAAAPASLAQDESLALEKLGRLDQAADALRPALSEQPQDVDLATRYAGLLLKAGRTDEALAAARAIDSDDEKVIWLLFEIYERRGEADRAIEEIRARLSREGGDDELTLRLADVLLRLNRPADAARTLDEYLRRNAGATAVRVKFLPMLVAAGEWEKALTVAADGLSADPQHSKEFEDALLSKEAAASAERWIQAAIQRDDFAGCYLAAMGLLAKKDREQAKALFAKAITAKPDFAPAHVALGRVYLDEFEYDRALEAANRAKELDTENARAAFLLAIIYDRLDQIELAEEQYRAAAQLDRSDTGATLALAELHLRTGQAKQAQLILQNLLTMSPNAAKVRELLSMVYLGDGKRDLAVQECEQIRNVSDAPTALARCLARVDVALLRDHAARRKMLVEAMEKGGPDADTWFAVAVTYSGDEYQARREALLRALELDPGHEDALAGLFEADKELALDFESAAQWLERLLKKRPNQHSWRCELAELYTLINDFERAVSLAAPFIERLDLEEKDLIAYRSTHIGALRAAGEDDRVTERLKRWAENDTAEHRWSMALADHYYGIEEYTKASEIYANLVATSASPEFQHRLTVALAANKQHDRAEQYVLGWLRDDPENDLLVSLLAGQLAEAGQVDAAIEVVRNQLLRTLRRQDFQDWMVARLSASDRHAEAVQLAEVLLDNVIAVLRQPAQFRGAEWQKELRDDERILYPDSFEADALHNRLANLRLRLVTSLFVAENYRRASELLNEWLEATNDPPTRFLYLRTLAAVEQAEGREEAAGGTMERALLLRPTDVGLNNDLSYTWIDRGVRLTDAETMIRFAVGRAPAHAAYLDTFGWLHYKKGDLIEAKKWLKRASFARRKEDPVIMDHLGDCAWRLGEKGEAIGYWNKAIELLNERPEDETANADERRAKREAPKKVEDASAGRSPQVAPLGEAPAPATVPDGKEKSKSSG